MGKELGASGCLIYQCSSERGSGLDSEQQPSITLRPAMQLSRQSTLPDQSLLRLRILTFFHSKLRTVEKSQTNATTVTMNPLWQVV